MSENYENIRENIHALINQGISLIQKDRYQEATKRLSEARYLACSNSFADEELQALISLSYCVYRSGDKGEGISLIESALKIACELEDTVAQGKCLLNLGVFHRGIDSERAIQYFRNALTSFERTKNYLGVAQSLDNIGNVYMDLGALRSAANYIDLARKAFEKSNEPGELATCLLNGGALLTDMANQGLEEPLTVRPIARKWYEEAFRIFEEVGSPVKAAMCLDSMGLLNRDEGKVDTAITLHRRAIKIFEDFNTPSLLSSGLLNLGNAYERKGDYEAAFRAFKQVRKLKKQLKDEVGIARVCNNEGVLMNTCARYVEASNLLKEAIQIWDELLKKLTDEEFYAKFAELSYISWTEYLYALSKQYEADNDEQSFLTLVTELEKSKARLLRRHIVESSSIAWQENPSLQLLHQEIELRLQISLAGEKRMKLRKQLEEKDLTLEQFDTKMQELISLAQDAFVKLEEIRRGMSKVPSSESSDFYDPRTMLSEIASTTSPPIKPVLVFMLDFPSRNTVGFGVMRDKTMSFKSVKIISDKRITFFNTLNKLHSIRLDKKFSQSDFDSLESDWTEMSCQLGDLLDRGKVLSSLKEGNSLIIFIPFGNWHLFPWEIAACAGGYLGTQHTVVRNYSSTLLNLVRNRVRDKTTMKSRLCAHIYCPHPDELPKSKAETTKVTKVLQDGGFEVVSFEKQQAIREQFIKKTCEDDFCLLHFAGHSYFDFRDSLLSGLWLRPDPNMIGDNGRTTALEIGRRVRFKDMPLIYLSSCKSAVVEVQEGDEPFGLVRAFLLSGASSLVLSNLSVITSSAPDMAKAFYEEILRGSSPAEALCRARLEVFQKAKDGMYKDEGKGHFIHWGPFCIYGDPLAVAFTKVIRSRSVTEERLPSCRLCALFCFFTSP